MPPRTDYIFTKGVSFALKANRVLLHDDYSVSVKDLKTNKQLLRLAVPFRVLSAAISPDGRVLAVSESHTGMHLFDANTGVERGSWDAEGIVIFSPDSKHVAWREGEKLVIRDLADVLANAKSPTIPEFSEPAGVPLRLELISKKSEYLLDRNAATVSPNEQETPTRVEMELIIRNTGTADIKLESLGTPDLFVFGDGAINRRVECQTGLLEDLPPEPPKLAPGQVHRVPVQNLNGECASSHWLLPGRYSVYAEWYIKVKPALAGKAETDGSGWVRLWSQPIQVKVIAP